MFEKLISEQNLPEYQVSEIANHVKRLLEDSFQLVKIRGEVSGLKVASSGHIYFNLKDQDALINAVCFRNYAANIRDLPEEGEEITVIGKITTYKQRSNYQILVHNIARGGVGALMELFEKRKKALEAEGLFLAEHKKAIPKIPQKIGVITSETGAVFHDICHRLTERFPLELLFYPAQVQGNGAELELANALNYFAELKQENRPDLVILARGGGSIEDLWCFNEEILLRAIFNCPIPVISAVGHETDTTLADFVADLRAPTPTAAAELATPDGYELKMKLQNYELNLRRFTLNRLNNLTEKTEFLAKLVKHPKDLLSNYLQRIDDLDNRFNLAWQALYKSKKQAVPELFHVKNKLLNDVSRGTERVNNFYNNLHNSLKEKLERTNQKVETTSKLIESLSYKNTLKRGYAVTRSASGKLINSKANFHDKQAHIEFYDGTVKVSRD